MGAEELPQDEKDHHERNRQGHSASVTSLTVRWGDVQIGSVFSSIMPAGVSTLPDLIFQGLYTPGGERAVRIN